MPSYRANGYLATALSQVKTYKATHEAFATQFGRNNQKPLRTEAAYLANLKEFVLNVDGAGGMPVSYSIHILPLPEEA